MLRFVAVPLASPSSYITLQLLHSEFPYIWGKNLFSFLSVQGWANRDEKYKDDEMFVYVFCETMSAGVSTTMRKIYLWKDVWICLVCCNSRPRGVQIEAKNIRMTKWLNEYASCDTTWAEVGTMKLIVLRWRVGWICSLWRHVLCSAAPWWIVVCIHTRRMGEPVMDLPCIQLYNRHKP